MTLVIRNPSATFTKFNNFLMDYPVVRGLTDAYHFGSSNSGAVNLVDGISATVLGAPTINAHSFVGGCPAAVVTGYETLRDEVSTFSYVAVVKSIASSSSTQAIGNLQNGAPNGTSIGIRATSQIYANAPMATVAPTQTNTVPVGDLMMIVGTADATNLKLYTGYGNVVTSLSGTIASRTLMSTNKRIRIAAHYYPTIYQSPLEVFSAAIHNVVLTPSEIDTIYQAYRARFARLGVSSTL